MLRAYVDCSRSQSSARRLLRIDLAIEQRAFALAGARTVSARHPWTGDSAVTFAHPESAEPGHIPGAVTQLCNTRNGIITRPYRRRDSRTRSGASACSIDIR